MSDDDGFQPDAGFVAAVFFAGGLLGLADRLVDRLAHTPGFVASFDRIASETLQQMRNAVAETISIDVEAQAMTNALSEMEKAIDRWRRRIADGVERDA